jgi:hypothetical protein
MKSKLLEPYGPKSFALVFDTGDEAMSGLLAFAKEHSLVGAHFTGIGAFSRVVLGYYDWEKKDYLKIPADEQVEVVSLIGDVRPGKGPAENPCPCGGWKAERNHCRRSVGGIRPADTGDHVDGIAGPP